MAVTDVGVATGGLGTIIAEAILQFNKANVFWNLVRTKSAVPGSLTVRFPVYGKIASSAVSAYASGAEDTDPTAVSISTTPVDIEVLRKVIRADITDLARYGSDDDLYENAGMVLGNAVAARFDDDIVSLIATFSQVIGDGSAAITISNLFDAVEALRTAGAPTVNGMYYGVLHPKQVWGTYGLSAVLDGIAFDKTNELLGAGYIGSLAGVELFTTPEIDPAGGTGTDEAKGLVFSPNAIGVGYKEIDGGGFINIEPQRDASLALTEIIANGYWNKAELVDAFGVVLHTKCQLGV